jgi:hypothetical protein
MGRRSHGDLTPYRAEAAQIALPSRSSAICGMSYSTRPCSARLRTLAPCSNRDCLLRRGDLEASEGLGERQPPDLERRAHDQRVALNADMASDLVQHRRWSFVRFLRAALQSDFENVFATLVRQRADALLVSADPFFLKPKQIDALGGRNVFGAPPGESAPLALSMGTC